MRKHSRFLLFAWIIAIPFLSLLSSEPASGLKLAKQRHERMGRGISLANFLEITNPSNRVRITTDDIETIKNAGFNTIRVPVRWEYDIDEAPSQEAYVRGVFPSGFRTLALRLQDKPEAAAKFLHDCEELMGRARRKDPLAASATYVRFNRPEAMLACIILKSKNLGLNVIVTNHHNNRILNKDWKDKTWESRKIDFLQQSNTIIESLQEWNSFVLYEILNEPNGDPYGSPPTLLNNNEWNEVLKDFFDGRKGSTSLTFIIGGSDWNSIHALEELEVPADANGGNIILTVHYYDPPCFTQAYEKRFSSECLDPLKVQEFKPDGEPLKSTMVIADLDSVSICSLKVNEKMEDPVLAAKYSCVSKNRVGIQSVWWDPWLRFASVPSDARQSPEQINNIGAKYPWAGKTGLEVIENDFRKLAQIAARQKYPVFLGEFGTTTTIADSHSRVKWAWYIANAAHKGHVPWVYWGYNSEDFGIFRIPEDSLGTPCITANWKFIKKRECSGPDVLRALFSDGEEKFAEEVEQE